MSWLRVQSWNQPPRLNPLEERLSSLATDQIGGAAAAPDPEPMLADSI